MLPTCRGEGLAHEGGGSCLFVRTEERRRRLACWGSFDGWHILHRCVLHGGGLDKVWSGRAGAGGRCTTFSILEEMTRMREEK